MTILVLSRLSENLDGESKPKCYTHKIQNMEEEEVFLKYLIDEDIYIIEDKNITSPDDEISKVEDNDLIDTSNKKNTTKNVKNETKAAEAGDVSLEDDPAVEYRNTTVLLIDNDNLSSMSPDHGDFLSKILNSVNLNLESIEMVFKVEFDKLKADSFTNCHVIAFLPFIPKHLNSLFTEDRYAVNIVRGNQFLACDPLNILSEDKLLKRKLWEQLKLIYGI